MKDMLMDKTGTGKTTDKKELKKLWNAYSRCKWMTVLENGEVQHCEPVHVTHVCIDKDGDMSVRYWRRAYDNSYETARVNFVDMADGMCIKGIFTDKKTAAEVAKKHFERQRLEEIKHLEERLSKLKQRRG